MGECKTVLFMIIAAFTLSQLIWNNVQPIKRNIYLTKGIKKKCYMHRAAHFFGEIVVDALMLNVNLFSLDSIKIITGFTPLYLGSRMIDESLQENFHDRINHKNIHQLPKKCHDIAHYGIGVPMVFLSSLAFWGWNEDLRMTARLFAIGLPFVHSGKDIIKKFRFKSCLRPWHEDFGSQNRSSGGFPSGHMANVAYMTTLFGMRHGPAWGVPLGLFATFVFVDFVNCNRHYLSQLFAGTALGVIFAYAAHKIVDQKLEARCFFDCVADASGGTALKFSYQF
jgi:hypothetical protein